MEIVVTMFLFKHVSVQDKRMNWAFLSWIRVDKKFLFANEIEVLISTELWTLLFEQIINKSVFGWDKGGWIKSKIHPTIYKWVGMNWGRAS